MNILFWQDSLSIHQSAHIRSLSAFSDINVTLISDENIQLSRSRIGWTVPDFGQATIIVKPEKCQIEELVSHNSDEAIHIFSGYRGSSIRKEAFRAARKGKSIIGIMSEPSDWRGAVGLLRLVRGRVETQQYAYKADFVLGIGEMGQQWFRHCGYTEAVNYCYGYFVERRPFIFTDSKSPIFQIIFVGQLVKRKNVDVLLLALSDLQHLDWNLKIVGTGDQQINLQKLALDIGIDNRVTFLGAVPNNEVHTYIALSDVLVLPSQWDGWGAVTNEALMQGTPVICSDYCGAADLLTKSYLGEIFQLSEKSSLTRVLGKWISKGKSKETERCRIHDWSERIKGDVAARYLLDILANVKGIGAKPKPPWKADSKQLLNNLY